MKNFLLIAMFSLLVFGSFYFQIWRVHQFQKVTGFGFWKAWIVLGK